MNCKVEAWVALIIIGCTVGYFIAHIIKSSVLFSKINKRKKAIYKVNPSGKKMKCTQLLLLQSKFEVEALKIVLSLVLILIELYILI